MTIMFFPQNFDDNFAIMVSIYEHVFVIFSAEQWSSHRLTSELPQFYHTDTPV